MVAVADRSHLVAAECSGPAQHLYSEAPRQLPGPADVGDCLGVIRVVLTDFDGVIRLWPAPFTESVEDRYGLERGSLARAAFDETILNNAVTGRVTDTEWRAQITRRLGSHTDPATAATAVAVWSASPGVVDAAALGVLQTARSVAVLGLVRNATTRLADDLARLALDDVFDFIINSSAIGCAKPSGCFYEHAVRRCECRRDQVLFVDDRSENVAAAIDFGFRGHHYRDPRTLDRVLRECGVIRAV